MADVLLVEDTITDEKLALLAIKASGVEASTEVARDGQEAVDRILGASDDQLPSLVLLDLNLPRLSGLEVLRRVRADARKRHLPVVLMTTAAAPADVARSCELGANAFVLKPAEFDDLTKAMATTLTFWLKLHRRIRS